MQVDQTNMTTLEQTRRKPLESPRSAPSARPNLSIQQSETTTKPYPAMESAQRAARLQPDDPGVQQGLQQVLGERTKYDPFVGFVAETDKHYVVTLRTPRPIIVPKARVRPETFPPPRPSQGERVLGMVWWLLLGLVPAGVGTMILSPFVILRALRVLVDGRMSPRDRWMAWLAIILAAGLDVLGTLFGLILLFHLAY